MFCTSGVLELTVYKHPCKVRITLVQNQHLLASFSPHFALSLVQIPFLLTSLRSAFASLTPLLLLPLVSHYIPTRYIVVELPSSLSLILAIILYLYPHPRLVSRNSACRTSSLPIGLSFRLSDFVPTLRTSFASSLGPVYWRARSQAPP